MRRPWFWMQLIIGWFPVWALYTTLIVTVHHPASTHYAAFIAFRAIVPAALLGLLVARLTRRFPWPSPMRLGFIGLHFAAAPLYSASWILTASLLESVLHSSITLVGGPGIVPFMVLGIWLYVMIAGVSYASSATERAAMAEANAAQAQLAALRSQLHPHFLFNALHTVVHLIPREPARAADAAVELAGLLRTTIEEDRDLVPLSDEIAFIERYLAIERIRFGDRLRIETDISPEARRALVPSFAVQTLVENAVRHGATPRVEPTTIHITGSLSRVTLTVSVRDDGAGANAEQLNASARGTGLARLRERLGVLYGGAASLTVEAHADGPARGVRVTLAVPTDRDDA